MSNLHLISLLQYTRTPINERHIKRRGESMSRLYCPHCGEELAQYQQDAQVQFSEVKSQENFHSKVDKAYEMFECLECKTRFVLIEDAEKPSAMTR